MKIIKGEKKSRKGGRRKPRLTENELAVFCLSHRRRVAAILLVSLCLIPFLYRSGVEERRNLLEKEGEIIAFDATKSQGSSLIVEASREGKSIRKSVYVAPKEAAQKREDDVETAEETGDLAVKMDEALVRVKQEAAAGKKVILPRELDGGIRLMWTRPKKAYSFLLPIPVAFLTILFLYRQDRDKEKKAKLQATSQILTELPGFADRLVMLLDSGLIYDDAFFRSADSYREREGDALAAFVRNVEEKTRKTGGDLGRIMAEETFYYPSSPLRRMTALIVDNRHSGRDLRTKLSIEAKSLWNERKANAEEEGKLAETKLALPLGIMLIVLIVVTATPAFMQM